MEFIKLDMRVFWWKLGHRFTGKKWAGTTVAKTPGSSCCNENFKFLPVFPSPKYFVTESC
jgi:hypothetical protein